MGFDFKFDKSKIEKLAMTGVTERIERIALENPCPTHGETANVVETGTGWEITGCCQELVEAVKAKIGEG